MTAYDTYLMMMLTDELKTAHQSIKELTDELGRVKDELEEEKKLHEFDRETIRVMQRTWKAPDFRGPDDGEYNERYRKYLLKVFKLED